jgi:putative PIN family toxin of toxin-antitoxin system
LIRVAVDTNILISALQYGGVPGEFLDRAFQDEFLIVTSTVLLLELEDKLLNKFRVSAADFTSIRLILVKLGDVLSTRLTLAVIKADPDDDRVLECAMEGNADIIVSGDRHLLSSAPTTPSRS